MAQRIQSPSSINLYKQCPRRYYYRYIENLPTSPSIHLIRGNIAHKALEEFFTWDPEEMHEHDDERLVMARHMLKLLVNHWQKSGQELTSLKLHEMELSSYLEETKLMVFNYVDSFHKKITQHMEKKSITFHQAFHTLKPITEKEYVSETHRVRGFVDAIEVVDGKVRLMDYKTSKGSEISESYRLQLAIYALLYEHTHKEQPHEVGIYFLKTGEKILPVDKGLITHAQFEIEQIHAATETDDKTDYPMKQSALCRWSSGQCDYYEKCFGQSKLY